MLGDGETATTDSTIVEGTDANFMTEVVDASRDAPVIVDFWAPWCGPCRSLTPILEAQVKAAKGAVKLVKLNIDENPRVAQSLRVQSIPAVFAFKGGQPIDGFMGALPESQVKAFIERLTGPGGPSEIDLLLEDAAALAAEGDLAGAAAAYAQALQLEPDNLKAIAGLARSYLDAGDAERAAEVAAMAPRAPRTPSSPPCAPPWPWPNRAPGARRATPRPPSSRPAWRRTPRTTRPASSWPNCRPPRATSTAPPTIF